MGDSWERLLPVGSQPKLSLLTLGSFHCHPTTKGWFGPCARSGFRGSHCWTLFGWTAISELGEIHDEFQCLIFSNFLYYSFRFSCQEWAILAFFTEKSVLKRKCQNIQSLYSSVVERQSCTLLNPQWRLIVSEGDGGRDRRE